MLPGTTSPHCEKHLTPRSATANKPMSNDFKTDGGLHGDPPFAAPPGSAADSELVNEITRRLLTEALPAMKDEPWLRKVLDEAKAAHMELPDWAKETQPPNNKVSDASDAFAAPLGWAANRINQIQK